MKKNSKADFYSATSTFFMTVAVISLFLTCVVSALCIIPCLGCMWISAEFSEMAEEEKHKVDVPKELLDIKKELFN